MELKIGTIHTGREIELDLDDEATSVLEDTEKALAGGATLVWFTDKKGRRVAVVAEKLAYLELSSPENHKKVGFSA